MIRPLFLASLAGILFGIVCFWLRPGHQEQAPATFLGENKSIDAAEQSLAGSPPNSAVFVHLLRPYLDTLAKKGTLDAKSVIRIRSIVGTWLAADPATCVKFLQQSGFLTLLPKNSFGRMAGLDSLGGISDAMRVANAIESPTARDSFLCSAVEAMAEKNPSAAFDAIQSLPVYLQMRMQQSVAKKWLATDINGALAAFLSSPRVTNQVLLSICREAGEINLQGAFDALNGIASAGSHSSAMEFKLIQSMNEVFSIAQKTNPQLGMQMLEALPPSPMRSKNLVSMSGVLAAANGDASALGPLDKLNQFEALRISTELLMQKDLNLAGNFAAGVPGVVARSRLFREIATAGASRDPNNTVKWLETIADPVNRAEALDSTFSTWVQKDPGDAFKYFTSNELKPDSPIRRGAELQLIDLAYSEDTDVKGRINQVLHGLDGPTKIAAKIIVSSQFDPDTAAKLSELFK